jgi:hypothetical protein
LRATVMTSQQGMDVSQSNLAPLDEGSPFSWVCLVISVSLLMASSVITVIAYFYLKH